MLAFKQTFGRRWRSFWLAQGGYDRWGRFATRMGSLGTTPFRGLYPLAWVAPKRGYIAPSAEIINVELRRGLHVFIGERVVIARWAGQGFVELGDGMQLNRETTIELFEGGHVKIGPEVGIQPRCLLVSTLQPIWIKRRAMIASGCAFFSYDHGIAPGQPIYDQPLKSKGPIIVEEDAWLGVGVTVMSGVTIGQGAVIAAGSVVTRNIPAGAVAAGSPARIVKHRCDLRSAGSSESQSVSLESSTEPIGTLIETRTQSRSRVLSKAG